MNGRITRGDTFAGTGDKMATPHGPIRICRVVQPRPLAPVSDRKCLGAKTTALCNARRVGLLVSRSIHAA